jgi:hypothetical protein
MHLLARYIRVNSITKGTIGWTGKWLAGFVSGVIVVAVVAVIGFSSLFFRSVSLPP